MPNYEHPYQESPDDLAVRQELERLESDRDAVLDDAAARLFASQLHTGQASYMYSLASTGAIHEELPDEIHREATGRGISEHMVKMYDAVGTYAIVHGVRGPVEGWTDVDTEPMPTAEQLIAEARQAWLGHVGANNAEAAAESFQEKYLGYYESQLAFARDLLTRQDVYRAVEMFRSSMPEQVTRFMSFDEDAYVESLTEQYYFAPSIENGVHVFLDD